MILFLMFEKNISFFNNEEYNPNIFKKMVGLVKQEKNKKLKEKDSWNENYLRININICRIKFNSSKNKIINYSMMQSIFHPSVKITHISEDLIVKDSSFNSLLKKKLRILIKFNTKIKIN